MFSYFGLQRRAWQQGGRTNERRRHAADAPAPSRRVRTSAWSYLESHAAQAGHGLPAARRLPVRAAVPVLLDGDHVVQAEQRAAVARGQSVLGHRRRRSAHFDKLLFDTAYPQWMWNTVLVSVVSTFFSLAASVLAAYAIERLRFSGAKQVGLAIFLAYLVPPSILFIPLAAIVFQLGLFDTRLGADPHLPDLPDPVLHLAADGLLPLDPVRAGGVRADRRRDPLADPDQDRAAAGGAGADLGRHLRLHAVVERVHLRADLRLVVARSRRCRSASSPSWSRATSTTGAR